MVSHSNGKTNLFFGTVPLFHQTTWSPSKGSDAWKKKTHLWNLSHRTPTARQPEQGCIYPLQHTQSCIKAYSLFLRLAEHVRHSPSSRIVIQLSCDVMRVHALSCFQTSHLSHSWLGFDVTGFTQHRDVNVDDDDNEDVDNEYDPWKTWKDDALLYDDIFPETSTAKPTKSEKNKVSILLQIQCVSLIWTLLPRSI